MKPRYLSYSNFNLKELITEDIRNSKFIFLGCTGYIGTELLKLVSLIDKNYNINNQYFIVTNRERKKINFHKRFKIINYEYFFDFFCYKDPIYVFHLGANYSALKKDNWNFQLKILKKLQNLNIKKIVFTSSGIVKKKNNKRLSIDKKNYIDLKLKTEEFIKKKFKKKQYMILRLYAFFGNGLDDKYNFMINELIRKIKRKKDVNIRNNNTLRTYMHTYQLTFMIFLFISKNLKNNILDLGSTTKLTPLYLVNFIKKTLDINNEISVSYSYKDYYYPTKNLDILDRYVPKIDFEKSLANYIKNYKL